MALVKEDVTGADKALFDSFGFVFDNEPVKAGRFTTWTVDRKRDIYFTYLGGGALERPSVYGLIWKNNKIIITTEIRGYIDKNHWLIESIKASNNLKDKKEELIEIIKETTNADNQRGIIIDKLPEPVFVEEERLNGR